jgi:gluconolactonase
MRVIAEDLWFPEGPVWVGDGSLLVVEIRRMTLTRIWPNGRKAIVAALGGGPNGAAMGPDGYCYVVNNGGFKFAQRADGRFVTAGTPDDYVTGRIERVNIETGKFEVLYDRIGDMKIRGPNDLVLDAHGGFYFTDPGKTRHRDWDRGSVCYGKLDGSLVRELVFPIHKPNGIGLAPDGKTLYVAETESARLWAWDLKAPGELAAPAVASPKSPHGSRLVYGTPDYARFDSLAVEANGNIAVATLDKGGITVCAPAGGKAEFVPVAGDSHITNICFGGPDLMKAYITLSYAGLLVEMDWPRPGLRLAA